MTAALYLSHLRFPKPDSAGAAGEQMTRHVQVIKLQRADMRFAETVFMWIVLANGPRLMQGRGALL